MSNTTNTAAPAANLKLTTKQHAMMIKFANNDIVSDRGWESEDAAAWSSGLCDNKSDNAVLGSLIKAGMMNSSYYDKNDNAVTLTDAGRIYLALHLKAVSDQVQADEPAEVAPVAEVQPEVTPVQPTTREVPADLVKLLAYCNAKISNARDYMANFTKEISDNPAYAMRWADGSFTAAADFAVYSKVADAITNANSKATYETIVEYATEEALRHARDLSRSTSPSSNIMHQETGRAWADLLDRKGRYY